MLGARSSQADVFNEVEPLVLSVLDGFNVCIFAYGQTGAGKTFTMQGIPEDPGINGRTLNRLFDEIGLRDTQWDYAVHVGMLEIYNEKVRRDERMKRGEENGES